MSVKIRLSRGGTKKRPYFYIVVAEAASPRDGRYIEQIGTHNPLLPKDNAAYGPLFDRSGARSFQIESARATARGVVARLEGVDDRTAAEALKGVELYVDRDRLPAAAEGEFYHADLIGLAAVDPEGKRI